MSPKRPQMDQINQRRDFSTSYSSVRRPFAKSTAQMAHTNAVMGSWGSAEKTTENRIQWDAFTFGGSKGYISGKGRIRVDKDEEVELIVVPSAIKIPEEKDESRTTSTNSKTEETLIEPQKEIKDSSTNPKIQAFRRELEEIALKHLGKVPENNTTSTPTVNTGSQTVNSGRLDHDDSHKPRAQKSFTSLRQQEFLKRRSYDEEGVITDFNSLPTEIEVSPTPTLRIHSIHPKSQILGDPKSAVQTRSKEPKKIDEALQMTVVQAISKTVTDSSYNKLWGSCRIYLKEMKENHGYQRAPIDKTLFISNEQKGYHASSVFQMSSMGELTFFLGLQVKQNKGGIFISQDKYVAEILKKFDLVNVKAAITPMETKLPLTKDEEAYD
ncbi:uncharacterized mitochondrial protein-like protein [Tanacetum coccineum]